MASEPAAVAWDHRLPGRTRECSEIDRLLARVREGESAVLVLRGEAGVGKTALLEYLVDRATRCRIARTRGIYSDEEVAFSGLQRLCAPFLGRIECLPSPQRDALSTALGLSAGAPPERFLVGLAALGLLSAATEDEPLVCVIDDAQWLDRASLQAFAFVAHRRPLAKRVAVIFAVRDSNGPHELDGLEEIVVSGLSDSAARALLDSVVTGPLDEQVRDRIVAETRGNPLALLELPRDLAADASAGGFGFPDPPACSDRIGEDFRRQLAAAAPATRQLLLVAAAEPLGDPLLVWGAAGRLGVDVTAAASAETLVDLGKPVRFRHPLARSAVYYGASPQARQTVHRALAEVTDPELDPHWRAWHRAHAATGPDEDVATELERSVGRARQRGGVAMAASFQQRAAELTQEPARRAQRALTAAQTHRAGGACDGALGLLAIAEAGPLDDLGRARLAMLRAQIAADDGRDRDALPQLLAAARRLEPLHPESARETYRDAFLVALTAGHLAGNGGIQEVAYAVRSTPDSAQSSFSSGRLLHGLAALGTDGYAVGAPLVQRALRAFRHQRALTDEGLRWLYLACHLSRAVWDDVSWCALSARLIDVARKGGALTVLRRALHEGVVVQMSVGDPATAASTIKEAAAMLDPMRHTPAPYGALVMAAYRGRDADLGQLIEATEAEMVARGEGKWLTAAHWATAVLNNGCGRYEDARAAAEQGGRHREELGLSAWSLVELIEAGVRSGAREQASVALRNLALTTSPSGTDWAIGIEARSRALLSEGPTAEHLYREAIGRLDRTRMRVAAARARLLYGEWLRRENRRIDAREQLHAAHRMLTAMGVDGFAERARCELLATGKILRKHADDTRDGLSAKEMQIARLAAAGRTNPEIGAELFLSPRTVEWHLRKVFGKLGVRSRKELADALRDGGSSMHAQWRAARNTKDLERRDGVPELAA